MRLKMHGPMPEKEAKAITVQILPPGNKPFPNLQSSVLCLRIPSFHTISQECTVGSLACPSILRSGLRHLNVSGRKIIHYDIKPSNVFYDAGQALQTCEKWERQKSLPA